MSWQAFTRIRRVTQLSHLSNFNSRLEITTTNTTCNGKFLRYQSTKGRCRHSRLIEGANWQAGKQSPPTMG
jgi:hypothetical protein